jgi:inhibitor of KinA sporulation pathway (predicted exonuclease)
LLLFFITFTKSNNYYDIINLTTKTNGDESYANKEEIIMHYIFVDFEMNPIEAIYREEKKICGSEIIEIGAVMLDENFQEISSFKELVKPQYNSEIYNQWEALTGITTEMINGKRHFAKVFSDFISWCGVDDYEIYAWSNSDCSQIIKEIKLKKIENSQVCNYMLSHWIDFQKIYGEMVSEENPISLENALNACGIPFSGRKHDALYDARNMGLLFAESKNNDLAKLVKEIKNIMCHHEENTTLGDVFNFERLGFCFA